MSENGNGKGFVVPEYVNNIKIVTPGEPGEVRRLINLLWEKAGEPAMANSPDEWGIRYIFKPDGNKIIYSSFNPGELGDATPMGEASDELLRRCGGGVALDVHQRLLTKAKMAYERDNP